MKTKTLNLTLSILLLTLFSSCKVENVATEYTVMLKASQGEDQRIELDEDTEVEFTYTLKVSEDSIDPWIKVAKLAQHASVVDCEQVNKLTIQCKYRPKNNYYGMDKIELQSGDGTVLAKKLTSVWLDVNPINDAPIAKDGSAHFYSDYDELKTIKFYLPLAMDVDTAQSDLDYRIIENSSEKSINCDGRQCTYIADANEKGSINIKYQVSDGTSTSNEANFQLDLGEEIFNTTKTFAGLQENNGVDILWVIDNSGSMAPYQEGLAQNFSSFATNLFENETPKFDFKMAVTTTDNYCNFVWSKQQCHPDYFDETNLNSQIDYASFVSAFSNAVDVGINGSGHEKAFLSADRVLNNFDQNASWKEPGHKLVVIFVSDEYEQSSNQTASEWAQILKSGVNAVDKAYAIIAGPDLFECDENPQWPSQGVYNCDKNSRYHDFLNSFGTSSYNLDHNFDNMLSDISSDINQLVSSFALDTNHQIDLDTLIVKVDGEVQVIGEDFTVEANNIYFSSPPADGASITVYYSYIHIN